MCRRVGGRRLAVGGEMGRRRSVARHVGDVVPGVAVQRLLEPVLVQVVPNQAHGTAKHKQGVDGTHFNVLVRLLTVDRVKQVNVVLSAFQLRFIY